MILKEVNKDLAYPILFRNHYSPVMPRLTKHYLGCFVGDKMEGAVTLGWGNTTPTDYEQNVSWSW